MSILARKAETPTRLAPKTIEYSYTLTVEIKTREGKETTQGQAVLRVDPSKPTEGRMEIISISDPENEALQDFLKDSDNPEDTEETRAESFWCGDSNLPSEGEPNLTSELANTTVVSETETEAVLRPDFPSLVSLLMQSDEKPETAGKKNLKLQAKMTAKWRRNCSNALKAKLRWPNPLAK